MERQFTQKYQPPPNYQYFMLDYYVITSVKVIILIQQIIALNIEVWAGKGKKRLYNFEKYM